MSFFQSSVVVKQLQTQHKETIALKWNLFKNHFHNPVIQENIRNSKEEQYQGVFLLDLFVNVLGYSKIKIETTDKEIDAMVYELYG